MCCPECPAEVGRAGEAPGGGDGRDRAGREPRIGEVAPAAFQPSLPDPARHRQALIVEELVQRAQGDVMCGGDGARRQLGVAQVLLNEGLHCREQGVLRRDTPSVPTWWP